MKTHRELAWMGLVGILVAMAACAPGGSTPITTSAPVTGIPSPATALPTADQAPATAAPAAATATIAAAAQATATTTESVGAGALTPLATTPMALDKIIADLAQRLGVPTSSVELISIESAEMSPPGLGCGSSSPAAPVLPAQIIGQVVRLRASGADYLYHAQGRLFVYCGPG